MATYRMASARHLRKKLADLDEALAALGAEKQQIEALDDDALDPQLFCLVDEMRLLYTERTEVEAQLA